MRMPKAQDRADKRLPDLASVCPRHCPLWVQFEDPEGVALHVLAWRSWTRGSFWQLYSPWGSQEIRHLQVTKQA